MTYDLEPEGGTFTDDGKFQLVVMQDNDAYAMYDVMQGKYLFMRAEQTSGAVSNEEGLVQGIRSRWVRARATHRAASARS